MFEWVECYGGPADGEVVPVDPADPLPEFPYMTVDMVTYFYQLRGTSDGRLRFFFAPMPVDATWTPVEVRGS